MDEAPKFQKNLWLRSLRDLGAKCKQIGTNNIAISTGALEIA